ncbi:MAG: aminotransferase class I/II-fold pyridoxal phosphate-dependent enzyme [Gemmatimonadetes bacterium]|nr:aminotransferase class I/II-fold pyridoxal phosphate-dependent enzyme [Gemmatimonadota bacterium]
MIDLRSDTVTQPTEAMRDAIIAAPVGDDVYGDDPSVNELERRTAEVLGKEAAVYMPTGTMTNQLAVRSHTEPGDTVLVGPGAHLWFGEAGAPSPVSGVVVQPLAGTRGVYDAATLRDALPLGEPYRPARWSGPVRLLCAENTVNAAGGTIWPLETQREILDVAREAGIPTHLDGARLWHASAATGIAEAEYAAGFDTVSVCFSKALGAPVGSALAGPAELIERARRFKQLYGGGFRQAGMMAAGALYALREHRGRLTEDHRRARFLAEGLASRARIDIDLDSVQTNIVRFGLRDGGAPTFVDRCAEGGVALLASDRSRIRAVPHLQTTDADIEQALEVMSEALG